MQTEHELEQLLRKAPSPSAPSGLEQRLIQQAGRVRRTEPAWSWFSIFQERSWAPALALLAVLAGLLTAVAVQQNTLAKLEAEKERAAREASASAQTAAPAQSQLELELRALQKDAAELQALRTEMGEIQKLLARQPQLAAENAALRAELSSLAKNDPANSPEIQAALAEARAKAGRIKCVNNLKNVGLAARIWATDNGDQQHLPKDFPTMTNELGTPKILICPADPTRSDAQAINTWDQFSALGSSYEILSPGIAETSPGAVYARCPFHNNVARVDGSVMQLRPDQQVVQRNGQWEIGE